MNVTEVPFRLQKKWARDDPRRHALVTYGAYTEAIGLTMLKTIKGEGMIAVSNRNGFKIRAQCLEGFPIRSQLLAGRPVWANLPNESEIVHPYFTCDTQPCQFERNGMVCWDTHQYVWGRPLVECEPLDPPHGV